MRSWATQVTRSIVFVTVAAWSVNLAAQEVGVSEWFVFEAGTPARAQEVNANFDYVRKVASQAAPPGTISAFAGAQAPEGWLLCDGKTYPAESYPKLAEVLSGEWTPASAENFEVPDLRGHFLRGADDRAARAETGTAAPNFAAGLDANGPREIGSVQGDSLQNITGNQGRVTADTANTGIVNGAFSYTWYAGADVHVVTGTDSDAIYSYTFNASLVARTSAETRPVNTAVHYIIKY